MASLTAQLWSSKGRRKIQARDLKLLGELRFIPNKRMHIEPKTFQKISLALVDSSAAMFSLNYAIYFLQPQYFAFRMV